MNLVCEMLLISACVCIPLNVLEVMIKRRESIEVLSIFRPNEKITGSEVCRRVREKTRTRDSVSYIYNTLNRLSREEDKLGWAHSISWVDGKKIIQKEFFLKR